MYDVVIVGGGPAGLSAAMVLARALRRVILFDDGQPRNVAAREMHGYLGHDGASPYEFLERGRQEVRRYEAEIVRETVVAAEQIPPPQGCPSPTFFRVQTKSGRTASGRKLLFASGLRDELPDVPGLKACYGASVHHCPYCDGWEHRGEHLLAYGESAHAAAGLGLALRTWSERVTVLTNGEPLDETDRQRLTRNGIDFNEQPILRLMHDGQKLQAVVFDTGSALVADALFFNTGHEQHCDLPGKMGCEYKTEETVQTSPKQRTNIPGLFLAGDADGDVQFVIVAAAEGATAAVAINRELQDEDRGEA